MAVGEEERERLAIFQDIPRVVAERKLYDAAGREQ